MEKHFVSYDIALVLKELGFDEMCFGYYYNQGDLKITSGIYNLTKTCILAPIYDQVFDYISTIFKIDCNIISFGNKLNCWEFTICNIVNSKDDNLDYDSSYNELLFDTPKDAKDACLKMVIDIIQRKNG
jgi:hypothetical protein